MNCKNGVKITSAAENNDNKLDYHTYDTATSIAGTQWRVTKLIAISPAATCTDCLIVLPN